MAKRKSCGQCLDRGVIEVRCPDCKNGIVIDDGRWLHCQTCLPDPGIVIVDCPGRNHR